MVEKPTKHWTTTCVKCKWTCHARCCIPVKRLKFACEVMKKLECKIGGCGWKEHRHTNSIFEPELREVTKCSEDIKKKYEIATGKRLTSALIIGHCKREIDFMEKGIISYITNARASISKLGKIAPRPQVISMDEYVTWSLLSPAQLRKVRV